MVVTLEPSLELATGQPDVATEDHRCHGDAVCREPPIETRSAQAEPAGGVDDIQELGPRRDEAGRSCSMAGGLSCGVMTRSVLRGRR